MTNRISFAVVALLVYGAGVLHAQAVLLAHWTFNEVSGPTAFDSEGSFNGTLFGGATFVAGGISGNALSLDGSTTSFVNMGASVPGFTTGDFSLVAWIKTTSTTESLIVAGKHEAGTLNGYFLNVNGSSTYGQPNKAFFYNSTNPGGEAISTTSVNDGTWHQLVGVRTAGGSIQIYVDGVLERTVASQPMIGNAAPFLVGGVNFGGTPTGLFTGLVDDVQIYSSALTSANVQYLFLNPGQTLAVPEPSVGALLATGVLVLGLTLWRRRTGREKI
jgi:hypothetical protein